MTSRENEFEGRPELVRKRARSEFWGKMLNLLVITLLVAVLVLVVLSIRANNEDKNNLLDCTHPPGKCYEQSQKNAGVLIDQLVDRLNRNSDLTRSTVILAAWCDRRNPSQTVDEAVHCINEGLKRHGNLSIRNQETDPSGQ